MLNCNPLSWSALAALLPLLPQLTELRLSTCGLPDPQPTDKLAHPGLTHLFLSSNPLTSLTSLTSSVLAYLPALTSLSVAECHGLVLLPDLSTLHLLPTTLTSLNLSSTSLSSVQELERLRQLPSLCQLRLLGCPLFAALGEAGRAEVIARLPGVIILNGGAEISDGDREDAERAFIRKFLDAPPGERPARVEELIAKHGQMMPLVKVDLTPTVFVRIHVIHGDEKREMVISVRQRVRHFKRKLKNEFALSSVKWQLWYYDQEMARVTGPEEISRFPEKGLYTLALRSGDYFVIEQKQSQKQG